MGKLTTNKNVILVVNEAKEYICKFKVLNECSYKIIFECLLKATINYFDLFKLWPVIVNQHLDRFYI
jgi:hypothetical protein